MGAVRKRHADDELLAGAAEREGAREGVHEGASEAAREAAAESGGRELYADWPQYSDWRFSADELARLRACANADAVARVRLEMSENGNAEDDSVFPNPQEELLLVHNYALKIATVCARFKLPEIVKFTATIYLRRMFLRKSVLDYSPKLAMLACVLLASKVENQAITVSKIASGVSGADDDTLKEMEFVVAESINFQFRVVTPAIPAYGIFINIQTSDDVCFGSTKDLDHAFKIANSMTTKAILMDSFFMYMPSQIAFSCWLVSAGMLDFREGFRKFVLGSLDNFDLKEKCTMDVDSFWLLLQHLSDEIESYDPNVNPEKLREIVSKVDNFNKFLIPLTSPLSSPIGTP